MPKVSDSLALKSLDQNSGRTIEKGTRDKRKKFVEIAESRTSTAIKAIRVIGKLGNKAAYEYDESDVRKITSALAKEVEALKARMLSNSGKETVEFKL